MALITTSTQATVVDSTGTNITTKFEHVSFNGVYTGITVSATASSPVTIVNTAQSSVRIRLSVSSIVRMLNGITVDLKLPPVTCSSTGYGSSSATATLHISAALFAFGGSGNRSYTSIALAGLGMSANALTGSVANIDAVVPVSVTGIAIEPSIATSQVSIGVSVSSTVTSQDYTRIVLPLTYQYRSPTTSYIAIPPATVSSRTGASFEGSTVAIGVSSSVTSKPPIRFIGKIQVKVLGYAGLATHAALTVQPKIASTALVGSLASFTTVVSTTLVAHATMPSTAQASLIIAHSISASGGTAPTFTGKIPLVVVSTATSGVSAQANLTIPLSISAASSRIIGALANITYSNISLSAHASEAVVLSLGTVAVNSNAVSGGVTTPTVFPIRISVTSSGRSGQTATCSVRLHVRLQASGHEASMALFSGVLPPHYLSATTVRYNRATFSGTYSNAMTSGFVSTPTRATANNTHRVYVRARVL